MSDPIPKKIWLMILDAIQKRIQCQLTLNFNNGRIETFDYRLHGKAE